MRCTLCTKSCMDALVDRRRADHCLFLEGNWVFGNSFLFASVSSVQQHWSQPMACSYNIKCEILKLHAPTVSLPYFGLTHTEPASWQSISAMHMQNQQAGNQSLQCMCRTSKLAINLCNASQDQHIKVTSTHPDLLILHMGILFDLLLHGLDMGQDQLQDSTGCVRSRITACRHLKQ